MDDAPTPRLRRFFSLGPVCVTFLVAPTLMFVIWLGSSVSAGTATSVTESYPQAIKLLEELEPEARRALTRAPEPISSDTATLPADSTPATNTEKPGIGAHQRDQDIAPTTAAVSDSATIEPEALTCRVWGPIGAEEVLDELRSLVADAGDVIEIEESHLESDPDYLVYIDTDQNIDNARRLLKELESQSVDAYMISGGELINSVSVGVFSRESRAQAHQSTLKEMGYLPRIEPLERGQTVFHLYARVPQGFETAGHPSADCAAIASLR